MIGKSLNASNPIRALAGRVGGVMSFVIGVVSMLFGILPYIYFLGVLFSLIGIALGMMAYRQLRLARAPRHYAVFGLVFSALGLFVSVFIGPSIYDKSTSHEEKTPSEQTEPRRNNW
jgi:uncharacterized membrane protein